MRPIHAAPFYYYFSLRFTLRAFSAWRISSGLRPPRACESLGV